MGPGLSNGLAGLTLMTGSNAFLSAPASVSAGETRAVRRARAAFTTPETMAPWKAVPTKAPVSAQAAAVLRMKSVVDAGGAEAGDVRTAFTAYKALDRLRLLAEGASAKTMTTASRASFDAAFARGLDDLQAFLGTAPSDALNLAFANPARRAESVALVSPSAAIAVKFANVGVAAARNAALPGVTGTERFRISLSRGTISDSVVVDLTDTPRPPTLDSVSTAINAAIAAVGGQTPPKWSVRFVPEKADGKWGLSLERGSTDRVSIDQIGAGDALMVAAGASAGAGASGVRVLRFDDPAGRLAQRTLGTIAASDGDATERAKLTDANTDDVLAPTSAAGIATDAAGNSYVVGTTAGDLGANLGGGDDDLFLSRLDSEGRIVWRRALGAAGSATGAAVTVAPDGGIVVAGTVKGAFDGAASDGDMLVARFDSGGEETFATLVRGAGADRASAVAVGADGAIFVGGRAASGGGDAFIARLDAGGRLRETRRIDSGGGDAVVALQVDAGGRLLALTREGNEAKLRRIDASALSTDLGSIGLGNAGARGFAVAPDGSIAVVGSTHAALPGVQVNATGGARDGFAARVDAGLSTARITYVGSAGTDEVDSVAYLNGAFYVGGRTTGALEGARRGTVDGFVGRVDAGTGAISGIRQFGQPTLRTDPVRVAAAAGGDTVLGALGLRRGVLTPDPSPTLVAETALRAGDSFSLRIEGGAARKITIAKADTLTTLANRVRAITGSRAVVTTPKTEAGVRLRIEAKPGVSIELIAGPDGTDALAKLGLPPARISVPDVVSTGGPKVRPGGSFGLDLTGALGLGTVADAKVALGRITSAISIAQTGYRSLYWDEGKAALENGGRAGAGASTQRENAQVTRYQAALDRLSTGTTGF